MPKTPAERRQRAQELPPLRDADAAAIEGFLDAIWAESGLAAQSLASYRRDLQGIARWRDRAEDGLVGADRGALFDYLAWRTREGYSPRSNARLLSALRAFYAHSLRRGVRRDDPAALLEPPRLPRLLPKALAESEIDALLGTPDLATPTGLRESELVGVPATALNLRQGVLRVLGKGGKERLVPLGEEAQHWLERYLADARPQLAGKRALAPLFLTAHGEAPTRQQFWLLVKRMAAVAGIDPARISPHGLRHSFAT